MYSTWHSFLDTIFQDASYSILKKVINIKISYTISHPLVREIPEVSEENPENTATENTHTKSELNKSLGQGRTNRQSRNREKR